MGAMRAMRSARHGRLRALAGAGLAAGLLAAFPASAAPAAVAVPGLAAVPRTAGAQLWVSRYDGPASSQGLARSVAVSPGGRLVFVTGSSTGSGTGYATIAYDTVTGAQVWARRYNGPVSNVGMAVAVAVSPDGRTVFVTGRSQGTGSGYDFATIAYSARTGAQRWAARFSGPGSNDDEPSAMAVSPDGSMVFVTGYSWRTGSKEDYVTVGYDTATGAQRWAREYGGHGYDYADTIAVSCLGVVFVGGNHGTVGYAAATGKRVWARTALATRGLAVSPDGHLLYEIRPAGSHSRDYGAFAYAAATGRLMWARTYTGPGNRADSPVAIAVSPNGGSVYVTGNSAGLTTRFDYATVAYDATTGRQRWARRYNGPASLSDLPAALAVGPRSGIVYVTGTSWSSPSSMDYATVAYGAGSGAQLWVSRYHGPGSGKNTPESIAVSPAGDRVFVTGGSPGAAGGDDYATVAYHS